MAHGVFSQTNIHPFLQFATHGFVFLIIDLKLHFNLTNAFQLHSRCNEAILWLPMQKHSPKQEQRELDREMHRIERKKKNSGH